MPRLGAAHAFLGLLASSVALELFSLATAAHWSIPFVHHQAHAAHALGLITGWLYARHLRPAPAPLYWREDFFPQGLRRRHADGVAANRRSAPFSPNLCPAPARAPAPALSNDDFLRQSVDPVLEKLYASGMASLTEDERRILQEAAQRFGTHKN